jgi:hypothetical protein
MKKLNSVRNAFLVSILSTLMLFSTTGSFAQTVETEKTYEISGKAKRGYLAKMEYDEGKQTYTLYFVTKANERRIKFEVYRFDKDYNFIDKTDEEDEMEKLSAKYKWFRGNHDSYVKEGVTVDNGSLFNMALTLKRKQTTYKWSWIWGNYTKNTKTLEKVKPKTEDGKKYLYQGHIEDDFTGDLLVLASVKDKSAMGKDFSLLRYNKELDLLKKQDIKFDYSVMRVFTRTLTEDDGEDEETQKVTGGMMIFAPVKTGATTNPDKNAYEILKFDTDFNITRGAFKSPASYFRIDEIINSKGYFYCYGVAAEGKDKYYNQVINLNKFKAVQLLKFDGSSLKVDYITSANLDLMESNKGIFCK